MKQFELKFGKGKITFQIDEKNYAGTLYPNASEAKEVGEAEVLRAIQNPIGTKRLRDLIKKDEHIVIITSDITRPVPSYRILPIVLEELKSGGAQEEDITIVLALGSHRNHTEEEKKALVGEVIYDSKVSILDSDMEKCIRLGMCKNGTPVDIFEHVAKADRRICVGNIEYHYFAGYSGGSKAIMPGVSSWDAIQANHANMIKEGAFAGNLDTNPVRQDIEEVTDFISIDFILNVILDEKKEIIKAVAGHHKLAHREGCGFLDTVYKIPIKEKVDIVVISPGGFPKDLNLYQAQKALDNAQHAVKDGGIIIWCASAKEGFGEGNFATWMREKEPKQRIREIRENFILGAHKAAAIAMVQEKCEIFVVSDLSEEFIKSIHLVPFATVQEAVDEAITRKGKEARLLVLPFAGSTLPDCK